MRLACIGVGQMGSALTERLLEAGHEVSVWNRSDRPIPAGAVRLASPYDVPAEVEVAFVVLSGDEATLAVLGDEPSRWRCRWVAVAGTVSLETTERLRTAFGDRLLSTPILGAPQAVRSGEARFVVGGPEAARAALKPLWTAFGPVLDAGERPEAACVVKLVNNQLLIAGLGVLAEAAVTARAGGLGDATIAALLSDSAMVPAGLRNRIEVLFDPAHAGWFPAALASKDLGHALALAPGAQLPLTRTAQAECDRLAAGRWSEADIAALIELG